MGGPDLIVCHEGKFSKISSALLFLFSNNLMLVIWADIHKMIVSIARSDCLICVCTVFLSLFGKQLVVEILVHLPYLQLRIIAEIMQKVVKIFCFSEKKVKKGNVISFKLPLMRQFK